MPKPGSAPEPVSGDLWRQRDRHTELQRRQIVVAALQIVPQFKPTFKLHLYRSTDGKQGSWTSQLLSVEKPLRDKKFPIPDSADRQVYHMSTKVITLGGDKGIVGWVDLW